MGDGEPDDALIRESDANGVEEASKSKKSKKSIKRKKGLGKQRPPSTDDIKISSVKKEEPRNDDTLHGTNPEEDVETTNLDAGAKKEKKKGKKKKNKSKASTKCEEVSEHELGKNAISHETESEHFQTANLKN